MPPLLEFSKNKFIGTVALEGFFPARRRKIASRIFTDGILLLFIPLLYATGAELWNTVVSSIGFLDQTALMISSSFLAQSRTFWLGIFYLLLAPRLILLAIEGFVRSKTAQNEAVLRDPSLSARFNLYATQVWHQSMTLTHHTSTLRILAALTETTVGRIALLRLGVPEDEYLQFLQTLASDGESSMAPFLEKLKQQTNETKNIALADLFSTLLEVHKPLHGFFGKRGITKTIIRETVRWAEGTDTEERENARWWSRARLGRIPGLAKNWSYGKSFLLNRFASDLNSEAARAEERLIGRKREIELLEAALLKKSGANVVLVGPPGAGKHTTLYGLIRMITAGKIFPALEHKHVLKLAGGALVAEAKTKGETDALFLSIMNEAVRVGNVILVIDDFPEFVASLDSLGSSATELLTPYLSSNAINIIALAESVSFRKILENRAGLMNFFERIEITEPDSAHLVEILKDLVPAVEAAHRYRTIMTYPALQKISDGAMRYIVTGALPKRAVELMEDVVRAAIAEGETLVTPERVMNVIEQKTKMPLGAITAVEQQKLLKLEEHLHERVVDQDEAIQAVANSVRRARSGIQNPKRPIGTFLFLGPTGVGKTETAKALAAVYFGNEDAMLRFDMSEYQTREDLGKLIGSFEKGEPGILASRIRSSPYGVMLLDEFEKSSTEIRNLFLQILDEGFFTDYLGEKINMRNTIIVATSNAGSQLIWELVEQKLDPSALREKIIAHIQKEKIMSPELLNRFDSIVVFHPLPPAVLEKIARILLENLASRLKKENNITLIVTDELVRAVAEGGYNPALGARPMQRFIQDRIEKLIAEKIIKGEIAVGGEVEFSSEELAKP